MVARKVPSRPDVREEHERALRQKKQRWRDQVMFDERDKVSYQAKCVGYAMADYVTMRVSKAHFIKTGEVVVFCSQGKIAEILGCNKKEVGRAIKMLRNAKHLKLVQVGIAPPTQRGRPLNEYKLRIRKKAEPN